MIKASVLYPRHEGSKFDMDYYCTRHIPLVQTRLGNALKNVTVEQGLAGLEAGSPPTYSAMGHLWFETVEAFQAAFAPHAAELVGDIPNYTHVQPVIRISEIKIDYSISIGAEEGTRYRLRKINHFTIIHLTQIVPIWDG